MGMRSLFDIISEALTETWQILFREFSARKFLIWGFCCWLVSCGDWSINSNFNVNRSFSLPEDQEGFWASMHYILNGTEGSCLSRIEAVLELEPGTLLLAIPVIAVVLLGSVAVKIVLSYLGNRFQFILLENILQNKMEIAAPWHRWKRSGNSYFCNALWRIALFWIVLIGLVISLVAVVISYFKVCAVEQSLVMPDVTTAGMLGGLFLAGLLLNVYMAFYTMMWKNYVVPAMYYQNICFGEAISEMWQKVKNHFWYVIGFCLLLTISLLLMTIFLVAVTCCIFSCLLLIPVVSGIAFLPLMVFTNLCQVKFYWALKEG